jgi:hypothetical protein
MGWLVMIIGYGTMPWLPGPINAWHNTIVFNAFMSLGIVWIFCLSPLFVQNAWAGLAGKTFRVFPSVLRLEEYFRMGFTLAIWGLGIFGTIMVCVDDPIIRSCTRDNFPVRFKLIDARNSVRGIVKMETKEGYRIWDLSHYPLKSNPNVYVFRVARNTMMDNGDPFYEVTWPEKSAVREMVYDFAHATEGRGSMIGFCGTNRELCLNGTVEIDPLRLEWTYTDPITKVQEEFVLESEGQWRFGSRHRPWVYLHRDGINGDVAFFAPSSKWVCGAGDGDLRNAIVPVGIIMIAEQQYKIGH